MLVSLLTEVALALVTTSKYFLIKSHHLSFAASKAMIVTSLLSVSQRYMLLKTFYARRQLIIATSFMLTNARSRCVRSAVAELVHAGWMYM